MSWKMMIFLIILESSGFKSAVFLFIKTRFTFTVPAKYK